MKRKMNEFIEYLGQEERSTATRRQYQRDIARFLRWAGEGPITKALVIEYKEELQRRYLPSSVNTKLAALNGFFSFMGENRLRVKQLRVQRRPFCSKERELTRVEYMRLLNTAKARENEKLALLLQTICGTGIRVSELRYITAEAIAAGEATIRLKGKMRTILITGKLQKALAGYLTRSGITTGPVFITRTGRALDRSSIWKMMKALCAAAGVERKKVFPHNLRHLFAKCFYNAEKDIAKLADILGHSSIETTRIYIASSGQEHRRSMDALGLVV